MIPLKLLKTKTPRDEKTTPFFSERSHRVFYVLCEISDHWERDSFEGKWGPTWSREIENSSDSSYLENSSWPKLSATLWVGQVQSDGLGWSGSASDAAVKCQICLFLLYI